MPSHFVAVDVVLPVRIELTASPYGTASRAKRKSADVAAIGVVSPANTINDLIGHLATAAPVIGGSPCLARLTGIAVKYEIALQACARHIETVRDEVNDEWR